jgi:ABC-type transport system involved in multi-copper enzyme maturation permease subunit
MVGPVLAQELMLGSRRGWQHIFRRIYTGWLILQLLIFYWLYLIQANVIGRFFFAGPIVPGVASEFAAKFLETLVWQQFILLALVTPAITAGAITDEKSRGTLQYLLAADLTSLEIILGKLFGRLSQVAILALAVLPLLCFVGVFGGASLTLVVAFLAVMVMPVVALAAASLLASVWSRQTRDAVLGIYICAIAVVLLLWVTGMLQVLNPMHALDAAWGEDGDPRELFKRLLISSFAWGVVAAACAGLAAWRLRPAYLRQLQGEGRPRKVRWWRARRAAVPDEPIRWKERHVDGIAPLASLRRIPRWLGVLLILVLTVASSLGILVTHMQNAVSLTTFGNIVANLDLAALVNLFDPAGEAFFAQAFVALLIVTLLVGVRCSGAITGERERQTWEALLLTPLPVRHLIRGKLLGIVGASTPYVLAYAIPAILLSLLGGIQAIVQTVLCFAVTWLAMGFMGAAGLWCSARFKSSWRSLLGTAGIGYGAAFVVFIVAYSLAGVVFLAILVTLALIDLAYGMNGKLPSGFMSMAGVFRIAVQLVLVFLLLAATWLFLRSTQRYIATRERIRHWKEEPQPVRRPNRRRRTVTPGGKSSEPAAPQGKSAEPATE